MSISRVVAPVVALCLGVGLALAVLWLIGVSGGELMSAGSALLVAVIASIARAVWQRSRVGKTSA